jgi:ABC-type multidrug transport system fused ATPase/permease subunit
MPNSSKHAALRRADPTDWLPYVGLYVPSLLAWLLVAAPLLSYVVAWVGSGWILWFTMTGRVRPLPDDRDWSEQLFRPLFLTQGMFAGYLCLGSVFYVWDLVVLGGGEFAGVGAASDIEYIAAAQRYSVLAHGALVHGILAAMDYRRSREWTLSTSLSLPRLFLAGGVVALVLMYIVDQWAGLGQFVVKLRGLAVVASILGTAYALRRGDGPVIGIGVVLYGWILVESFLSGWKEAPIVAIGLLLLALYPKYKRTVAVAGVGALVFMISVLPAYNNTFRQLNWNQEVEAEQAAREAIERLETGQVNLEESAWSFLTGRLTLINHLAQYVEHTPEHHPYYGLSIAQQGIQSIIPRVLWPEKPVTERMAMERVYENRVVAAASGASAKPSVIADGYLSGGALGVFLACFLLGAVASWASRLAERWFGGYEIGGQVVFVGLFAGTLLTASIEFLMNSLFWSFVLMGLLAFGLWLGGILQWADARKTTFPSAAVGAQTR